MNEAKALNRSMMFMLPRGRTGTTAVAIVFNDFSDYKRVKTRCAQAKSSSAISPMRFPVVLDGERRRWLSGTTNAGTNTRAPLLTDGRLGLAVRA